MSLGGPEPGGREPTMWQQFRRRRVIRTVLLYFALMFLAIEGYLFAAQFVALPPWGFRTLMGVVVLGFPFAVVLAWAYDVTPSGIVRTPEELGPEAPHAAGPGQASLFVAAGAVVVALALRMLRV